MGSGFNQRAAALATAMAVFIIAGGACSVLSYQRPPARDSIFVSLPQHLDSYSPQQVHISIAGKDKMRISWLTEESPSETAATVEYGASPGNYTFSAIGNTTSYKYMLYKSGDIHHAVIGPLSPSTIYYYRFGGSSAPSHHYNFTTPPSGFPIKFVVAGDLGQTGWTKSTLKHISESNYDMLLLPGDLSYADMYQPRWDSYGRLVEPLASERPWMVTQGNHEVEKIPVIHPEPFTAYNARWVMPFKESGSNSNLYYSFDVARVHVVMLGSYANFERGSTQYKWLQSDLNKINRTKTPWLVVLLHAPWYNSNTAHQGEKESVDMKDAMEDMLYKAKTDIVFSGHVHAYERFARVYKNKANKCGPMYITIGDGGNREGLATHYKKPHPKISMFREASFGHGTLEVLNGSHAKWKWHRNEDDESVTADNAWIRSLSSSTSHNSSCLH